MSNQERPGRAGTSIVVVFVAVLLLLFAAVLFAAWDSSDPESVDMTSAGYVAKTFGVKVTLGLRWDLMSLVYFSNRHGRDFCQRIPNRQSVGASRDGNDLHVSAVIAQRMNWHPGQQALQGNHPRVSVIVCGPSVRPLQKPFTFGAIKLACELKSLSFRLR